jgi:hypothetical protein
VVRYSATTGNQIAPLTKRLSDPTAAQQFYRTASTQPLYSSGSRCAHDFFVSYRISLFEGDQLRLQGLFSGGCPRLEITYPQVFHCCDGALYVQLSQLLGMTPDELFGQHVAYTAPPGSPIAPTPEDGYC